MMLKTYAYEIKHQPNVGLFVWNCDNLIESKPKQIMKINLKSIKY
jgi:hypothetical protein